MPISPTVQAYMQQGQAQPSSAEQIFNKSFSDQAFSTLKSRFPSLMGLVVTFKTLSSDVEKGDALGAFILSAGSNIYYIPVAMSSGSIVSCEMMYDKESDQFTPITEDTVKGLHGEASYSEPTSVSGKVTVDDTKQLFRNMVRPPASSNVVLAGSNEKLTALPNSAKLAVSTYFTQENPQLLAKIAAFYPVAELAQKLAQVEEMPTVCDAPEVIKISDLTKEAAERLSEEERKAMLDKGYVVRDAGHANGITVLPMDDVAASVTSELHLEEYPRCCEPKTQAFCTRALTVTEKGFKLVPAIVINGYLGCNGKVFRLDSGLIEGMGEKASESCLRECGFFSAEEFHGRNTANGRILVLVPARSGGWLRCEDATFFTGNRGVEVESADGTVTISNYTRKVVASPLIEYGSVRMNGNVVVPAASLFCFIPDEEASIPHLVGSMDDLGRLVRSLGTPIRVDRDGVQTSITDFRTQKTASFATDADAASFLQANYGLKGSQIGSVLSGRHSVLYKLAEDFPMQAGVPVPQGSANLPVEQMPIHFDPSQLGAYAEFEDPELMDTGILASFANDPDIKDLLVDYIPDFLQQQDKIGRIILLFSMNKRDLEAFYGIDKLAELLLNCRKIFKFLGNLVQSLKQYTKMV